MAKTRRYFSAPRRNSRRPPWRAAAGVATNRPTEKAPVSDTRDVLRVFASNTQHAEAASAQPARGPRPSLLTLPQELQDIIFDLAYPHNDVSFISRREWAERERRKRKAAKAGGYAERPFTHRVDTFTVSKAFFTRAARAYAMNQHFDNVLEIVRNGDWGKPLAGVVYNHAKIAAIVYYHLSLLHTLPQLCHIHLELGEDAFEALEPVYAWRFPIPHHDMRRTESFGHLMLCRGLRKLTVVAKRCAYAKSDQEKRIWEGNCQAFQDLVNMELRQKARQSAAQATPSVAGNRLYEGSKVFLDPIASSLARQHAVPQNNEPKSPVRGSPTPTSTDSAKPTVYLNGWPQAQSVPTPPPTPHRQHEALQTADVPGSLAEFAQLFHARGEAVMDWVRRIKGSERDSSEAIWTPVPAKTRSWSVGTRPVAPVFQMPQVPASQESTLRKLTADFQLSFQTTPAQSPMPPFVRTAGTSEPTTARARGGEPVEVPGLKPAVTVDPVQTFQDGAWRALQAGFGFTFQAKPPRTTERSDTVSPGTKAGAPSVRQLRRTLKLHGTRTPGAAERDEELYVARREKFNEKVTMEEMEILCTGFLEWHIDA